MDLPCVIYLSLESNNIASLKPLAKMNLKQLACLILNFNKFSNA